MSIKNVKHKKTTLEKYISYPTFRLGMRDRAYKLPPREFGSILEQSTYENGRLLSAALEFRGENYKKYIRYNKIVEENRNLLIEIINNDVAIHR